MKARPCMDCGNPIETGQRKRCLDCRSIRERQGQVPHIPCSLCGKLLFRNHSTRPPETRLCIDCIRSAPGYVPRPKMRPAPSLRLVRCACGEAFETTHPFKKWCRVDCEAKPKKPYPAKMLPQRYGRYGSAWNRVRRQVIAEETVCWLCWVPVDKARRFPDPWSATIDHLVPAGEGGSNDRENLRLAHFRCNNSRRHQR